MLAQLPQAVDAADALVLFGRVPGQLKVDNRIRHLQVKPRAACLG